MARFTINPITGQFDEVGSGGGGTVTSVSGTANRITSTGGVAPIIDIAATYIGQSSITTLGTLVALSVTGLSTLNGGQVIKTTVPGAYPYDVLTTDYVILVDTSAARTIRLPNAPTNNSTWVIKDNVGTASSFNISLTTVGGAVTIDGATTQTIAANWTSLTVVFNGTSYRII